MTAALVFLPKRAPDKLPKQRMRFIRSRLELGMELHPDVKTIFSNLDSLDKRTVGRCSADSKTCRLKLIAILIVILKAMSVPFGNLGNLVTP